MYNAPRREGNCYTRSMADVLLRNLITYLVTELSDAGFGFGKTKLVKLLYLVDVAHYGSYRRTLTGLAWVFHHYGPYAFEVDATLKKLSFDIPQEKTDVGAGHNAIVFRPPSYLQAQMKPEDLYQAKPLVDRVLREWGAAELNELLDFVYFDTEPMANAERGKPLDFSCVPERGRGHPKPAYGAPNLSVASQEALRQLLTAERRTEPLTPAPRYDEVYAEALARMNADEQRDVPGLEVAMPAEMQASFRAQEGS